MIHRARGPTLLLFVLLAMFTTSPPVRAEAPKSSGPSLSVEYTVPLTGSLGAVALARDNVQSWSTRIEAADLPSQSFSSITAFMPTVALRLSVPERPAIPRPLLWNLAASSTCERPTPALHAVIPARE